MPRMVPDKAEVFLNNYYVGEVLPIVRMESGIPVASMDIADVLPNPAKNGDTIEVRWTYTWSDDEDG